MEVKEEGRHRAREARTQGVNDTGNGGGRELGLELALGRSHLLGLIQRGAIARCTLTVQRPPTLSAQQHPRRGTTQ